MNYGDGWYGGVFMAAMYSTAFISDDIDFIVSQGLKPIPANTRFYQAVSDVIKWHQQYPDDWKKCWFEFLVFSIVLIRLVRPWVAVEEVTSPVLDPAIFNAFSVALSEFRDIDHPLN